MEYAALVKPDEAKSGNADSFLVKIALVEIGKIQYNGRRKGSVARWGCTAFCVWIESNRGKY